MIEALMTAQEDRFAIWNIEMHADVNKFQGLKPVQVSKNGIYNQLMCCYYNVGLDAYIQYGKCLRLQ